MESTTGNNHQTIEKLNGKNFVTWKYRVKVALMGKNLYGYANGTNSLSASATQQEREKYMKDNQKALEIIVQTLDADHLLLVIEETSASSVWQTIGRAYAMQSWANYLRLFDQTYHAKKISSQTMLQYISGVLTGARELRQQGETVSDRALIAGLLKGLPEIYQVQKTIIVNRQGIKFEEVTSILLQQEAQTKEKEVKEEENALVVQQQRRKCFGCGSLYHFIRNCPNRNDENQKVNHRFSKEKTHPPGLRQPERTNRHAGDNRETVLAAMEEVALQTQSLNSLWIIDSGATSHMTGDYSTMTNVEQIEPTKIKLADNSVKMARFRGTVRLKIGPNGHLIKLDDVLYVPDIQVNLFSVGKAIQAGHSVTFDKRIIYLEIANEDRAIEIGQITAGTCLLDVLNEDSDKSTKDKDNDLFTDESLFDVQSLEDVENEPLTPENEGYDMTCTDPQWHLRLGHLNYQDIDYMAKKGSTLGLDTVPYEKNGHLKFCEACAMGKNHRLKFQKESANKVTQNLELVSSDIMGPIETESLGGAKYVNTYIDANSNMIFAYFIARKSDALETFKKFLAYAERRMGTKLKTLRTDNGGEFTSAEFKQFCQRNGIERQLTVPYTPEQNGQAERMNRTIAESARSMLKYSGLSSVFWAEAMNTAAYLHNRTTTRGRGDLTPFEIWSDNKPSARHLRTFGCTAYSHIPKEQRQGKLADKSIKCIFVGYSTQTKGYRLYDPRKKEIIIRRDVLFNEEEMYAQGQGRPTTESLDDPKGTSNSVDIWTENTEGSNQGGQNNDLSEIFIDEVESIDSVADNELENEQSDEESDNSQQLNVREQTVSSIEQDDERVRRSGRTRRIPGMYARQDWSSLHTENQANIAVSDPDENETEPTTLKQAKMRYDAKHWIEACHSEYDSLQTNRTWELVQLPKGRKPVTCKWVFKKKLKANGEVDKYKARLVARGFTQTEGIDYKETFAPVIRYESIRAIIAVVTALDLELHQMDVTTAFLNGTVDEEIYMRQPEGFEEKGCEELVCRLRKSLYGLKQAPRCWNETINGVLHRDGFQQGISDPCIYTKFLKKEPLIVGLYVDDLLIAGPDNESVEGCKRLLQKNFKMQDMGELKEFLGIQIVRHRTQRKTHIRQEGYLTRVLSKFGMMDCRPVKTPEEPGYKASENDTIKGNIEKCDDTTYRSAVGSLMYAMVITRPDLSHSVGDIARYMTSPTSKNWIAVKRIFRYIRGTLDYGLCFNGKMECPLDLIGYSDASYANVDGVRSTTGYTFKLAQASLSWKSERQRTIAISSTEAEYMAASRAAREAIWLRQLLSDLGLQQAKATTLYEDNQACIFLSKNPVHRERTKHINIQFHFIREKIEEGHIDIKYMQTRDMVADTLTKGLSYELFTKHRNGLGVFPLSGSVENAMETL